jgi:hypothetical protein
VTISHRRAAAKAAAKPADTTQPITAQAPAAAAAQPPPARTTWRPAAPRLHHGVRHVLPRCHAPALSPAPAMVVSHWRPAACSARQEAARLPGRRYNLAHKYGLGSTYSPSEPSFVANDTSHYQAAQQYLLQSIGDPALGLLIPYGGKIRITSSQTGLPCGLYPRPYDRSPTGSALALYCNATDSGAEFVYEVRAWHIRRCCRPGAVHAVCDHSAAGSRKLHALPAGSGQGLLIRARMTPRAALLGLRRAATSPMAAGA